MGLQPHPGCLKNLDHRVARSTMERLLKDQGIPPVPDRPTSWRTFLRAHWGKVAAADFFTTEVWRPRGLVTYYTLFVLDLRTRLIVFGERRLRHVVDQFVVHYHGERNHQGLGNGLIAPQCHQNGGTHTFSVASGSAAYCAITIARPNGGRSFRTLEFAGTDLGSS